MEKQCQEHETDIAVLKTEVEALGEPKPATAPRWAFTIVVSIAVSAISLFLYSQGASQDLEHRVTILETSVQTIIKNQEETKGYQAEIIANQNRILGRFDQLIGQYQAIGKGK